MLEQILQDKRAEVAQLNENLVRNVRPSTRNLSYSLGTGRSNLSLFVELKRRDPREGDLRPDLNVVEMAKTLETLGVGALVVTTEKRHWGGSRNDLIELDRSGIQIPLIRNDFIIEELQLYESRRAGADSVFLRASLMEAAVLQSSLRLLTSMHMIGAVWVDDPADLERALETDAPVIAISGRNPETGEVDLEKTLSLADDVPNSRSVVVCSGVRSKDDLERLRGNADAICIGSALLRSDDPAGFLRQLVGG